MIKLKRYEKNPIIKPTSQAWESKATFNPGVVRIKEKTYLLYRAMSEDNTSTLGLAITSNGFEIEERLKEPIYVPREPFEMKVKGYKNTGCEDPRLTIIGDRIFMCYTAVGESGPYIRISKVEVQPMIRVALTSIKIEDFVKRKWNWEKPILISPPGTWDKDACILERKVSGKFVFFHRIFPNIYADFVEDLTFKKKGWIFGYEFIACRPGKWDDERIGIAGPPIFIKEGWVLIYHGRSSKDGSYRLGAVLLDAENPVNVLARLDYPILEPEEEYEKTGQTRNVVFSCGQAIIDDTLFVYYGSADKFVCVATCRFDDLVSELVKR